LASVRVNSRQIAAVYSQIVADKPLAEGFDILLGRYQVTIPADTAPGDDYSIVGESLSSPFTEQFTDILQCSVTLGTVERGSRLPSEKLRSSGSW
jgi:hypothetical protein